MVFEPKSFILEKLRSLCFGISKQGRRVEVLAQTADRECREGPKLVPGWWGWEQEWGAAHFLN